MELKPGYKQTEMGVVPEDWKVSPLEAFTSFISYGFTNPMPTSESGVYMVTAKDINGGRIQFETARCTTEEAYRTFLTAKSRPQKGDLLLTKDGTLGRLALVGEQTLCINQSVAILRPNSEAVPEFLKVLLEAPTYQSRMLEDAGGSTIKHIYITIVNQMPLAVPPTKGEQEAIAGALRDADALIDSLEQVITKKRNLKQGATQELLSGKKRLPSFNGKWDAKLLGDIATLNRLNIIPASQPDQVFVHFSLPAFDADKDPVVEPGAAIGSNKFRVPQDAVLVSKLNPRIPRIWSPSTIPANAIASTEFLVLTPKEGVSRGFLFVICSSPSFCDQMKLSATGTTGSHQRISPGGALSIKVLVPNDLDEQSAISAVLGDMDGEIAALEAKLAKARHLKQGMMQELLTGKARLV